MISKINNDYNRRTSILGSLFADVKLSKNLAWHTEANGSSEFLKYYSFHPSYTIGGLWYLEDAATSTRSVNTNTWWSLHSRVTYDLKLDKHDINSWPVMRRSIYVRISDSNKEEIHYQHY